MSQVTTNDADVRARLARNTLVRPVAGPGAAPAPAAAPVGPPVPGVTTPQITMPGPATPFRAPTPPAAATGSVSGTDYAALGGGQTPAQLHSFHMNVSRKYAMAANQPGATPQQWAENIRLSQQHKTFADSLGAGNPGDTGLAGDTGPVNPARLANYEAGQAAQRAVAAQEQFSRRTAMLPQEAVNTGLETGIAQGRGAIATVPSKTAADISENTLRQNIAGGASATIPSRTSATIAEQNLAETKARMGIALSGDEETALRAKLQAGTAGSTLETARATTGLGLVGPEADLRRKELGAKGAAAGLEQTTSEASQGLVGPQAKGRLADIGATTAEAEKRRLIAERLAQPGNVDTLAGLQIDDAKTAAIQRQNEQAMATAKLAQTQAEASRASPSPGLAHAKALVARVAPAVEALTSVTLSPTDATKNVISGSADVLEKLAAQMETLDPVQRQELADGITAQIPNLDTLNVTTRPRTERAVKGVYGYFDPLNAHYTRAQRAIERIKQLAAEGPAQAATR